MSETLLGNHELRHVLHDYQDYSTTTVGFLLNRPLTFIPPKGVHNAEIPVTTSTPVARQKPSFSGYSKPTAAPPRLRLPKPKNAIRNTIPTRRKTTRPMAI